MEKFELNFILFYFYNNLTYYPGEKKTTFKTRSNTKQGEKHNFFKLLTAWF